MLFVSFVSKLKQMVIAYRFSLILFLFLVDACQNPSTLGGNNTQPPSHTTFDLLLKKHVSNKGIVDYKSFKKDEAVLDGYLNQLDNQAPDRLYWTKEEQLAYWINAYNAFTIKLILLNYPLKSIQDLHPKLHIPLFHTVWHKEFFTIGGKKASLDEIEHGILRKEFDEPKIHFAINCASKSCPPLLNEAYTPEKLNNQLETVTTNFINNSVLNQISKDEVKISAIFNWFKDDFTKRKELIAFLNGYSAITISGDAKVSYLPYNWDLNE